MPSVAAADGAARRGHYCCIVRIVGGGRGGPRVVRWGMIGGGDQNRKTIVNTVLGNRYLNTIWSGSVSAQN